MAGMVGTCVGIGRGRGVREARMCAVEPPRVCKVHGMGMHR